MGLKELKSNLAKAGWVPWSAWRHSQTNICTGRDKVGGWRWECCLRLVLMPDAWWWPTEDLSHFMYFQISESTFLASRVVVIWLSHGETWGWGCSFWGGGCKQDQLQHENVQHLHCLFINHNDSLWLTFTYLNVKITCVLSGTSDSGCGFTSGHFLISGWTVLGLEKTLLRNMALSSHLCVWRD